MAGTRIPSSAVWLTHDPEYPDNLPAAPLVRYGWTPRGELAAVYDRSNTQVRSFTYDDKYRGRMVAHRHTGRPEIRYRYDSDGLIEQLNPAGFKLPTVMSKTASPSPTAWTAVKCCTRRAKAG